MSEQSKMKPLPPSQPIRALHIIQGKHFGGAEQVVLTLVKCFDRSRVDASVLCLAKGLLLDMLAEAGIPNFLIAMRTKKDVFIPLFKTIRLIKERNIDIIHTHSVRSNLIGRLAALFARKKCVTHLHSPVLRDFADFKRGKRNELIDSITRPIASHYITVSRSLRRELIARGMNPANISTIHNGLDPDSLHSAAAAQGRNQNLKKELKLPDDAILLVLVALIRPRKGVEILIRAFNKVEDCFPNSFLIVVGNDDISEDPAYGPGLRELASGFGLSSRVIFTGFRSDVIAILKQADLMILPSLFGEGLPMVILEAMTVGLPVIASNIEGIPEIIKNGKNGILVTPGVPAELSEAITDVLSNPALRKKITHNAARTIETEFNIKIASGKMEGVYHKVLNDSLRDCKHR